MSRGWLVVFAKAPHAGLVKTRMSPPLSLEECAAFYAEMLGDVLGASADFALRLDLEPVVAAHPPEAMADLVRRVPPGFRLHAQRGGGLGERMAQVVLEAAAAGARRVLLRGSDSPTLPFDVLSEVMQGLDDGCDAVLVPDQGGGYAAIGLRRHEPRLFAIEMSTRSVLEETLARAAGLGLAVATTAPVLDLDTAQDVTGLRSWLSEPRAAEASAALCPRTLQYLEQHPRLSQG